MPFLLTSLLLAVQTPASTPTAPPLDTDPTIAALERKAGLRYEELFPRRSYFGKTASKMEWSKDGKLVAYLWAPYDHKGGNDLYIYDRTTKTSTPLTSPENMARFDRKVPLALERYKKDREEEAKADTMTDLDYREWRLKRKEEAEKRTEPLPDYPGVSEFRWNPTTHDLLFVYRGDVFRTSADKSAPVRLTRTKESEHEVRWLPHGEGYTYELSSGVFRVKFDAPSVEQLNPELPKGISYTGYRLSPDGTKLMVTGYKAGPASRQVDFLSYRDRLAQAKKTDRDIGEDDFHGESYVYLYDLGQDSLDEEKGDGKPWEVWKWPGGQGYQQISVNEEPWSPDSKRFAFGTWKRATHDQEIVVADTEAKKLKTIYKGKPDGEMHTPGIADPFFTKDGKNIIALLDTSGYRHAWLLNPDLEGASPITKGDFECYPIKQSADGKYLFVRADKENTARMDVYRIAMDTGAMERLTHQDGRYEEPALTDDGSAIAADFHSWTSPTELYALSNGHEDVVTHSHHLNRDSTNVFSLKPQLFTYVNRHGQTIHGYEFLPAGMKKGDHRPLFLYVYGGPLGTGKSVEDGSFNSTSYLFASYLTRVFGYVTATIDPRGQSEYGNVFGKANFEHPGVAQVEDLSDGVKYFVDQYGIDPKKVGINGWSFGGFQTQMCMYTAPDVFTLGIAGAGPTQWQNYNNWYSTGAIGPVPTAKAEDLDKYSLTYLAKNLRSPLMLLHGMEDTNVLFQDTVAVYRKLLQYGRGPLVELALDPTGNHGMGGDMDTRDRHAIYLSFINRWWGPYNKP